MLHRSYLRGFRSVELAGTLGVLCVFLSGCAFQNGDVSSATSAPVSVAGSKISGSIHGGQQPVAGATVQLWQVGTTGYGLGATPLGSSATSAADGTFSITGDYSCSNGAAGSNTLVYITAAGGNPGLSAGTNNTAILMMVGLGTCGNLTPSTFISINELTTVASVYSLAQFMGPSGGVGSYGTTNQGLANAFATIPNLVDTAGGAARSVTPQGNGIVPQAELNTLADILSPCVNSSGPTSGPCSSLFGTVAASGGGGPSTVLGAALQIALNPGYNVTALLGQSAAVAPFQPILSSAHDWTVAVSFASGGGTPSGLALDGAGNLWVANYASGGSASSVSLLSAAGIPASNSPFSNANINGASAVAIDAGNNAWVVNHDNNSAVELSAPAGAIQVAGGPFTGLNTPTAVAIDRSNDIWFVNQGNNSLTELLASNLSGTPATFTTLGLNQPAGLAFDGSNNAWITNSGGGSVTKLALGATPAVATSYTGGGLTSPAGIAIDGASNVWVTDPNLGEVAELSSSGASISSSSGITGGGITGSQADAIDGSGNVWIADSKGNALSALTSAGAALSPTTGFTGGSLSTPVCMAIDASGNIWIANGTPVTTGSFTATLTEFVGLASPAITPLAVQVKQAQLAERPGTPVPIGNAGGPYSGTTNAAISFNGSNSSAPTGQTLSYSWSFGDGTTGSGATPTHTYATGGTYTATLIVTATDGASAPATALVSVNEPAPTIANFSPASGPVGTVVTVTGTNLAPPAGTATQVFLAQQGGSTILAPVSAITPTSLSFVIPAGAATGAFTVTAGALSGTSAAPLTVMTSSTYALAVSPGTGTLIQGQSTSLAVSISSTNNFAGVANLSVSGVPSGVSATFQPNSVGVGQTALLTLTAPSGQTVGTVNLVFTASSTIDGLPFSQTTNASLNVKAATTTFLGRTVVDDAAQEPLAGVTVMFTGMDDKGNHTGCSGSTVSDGGGNFVLSNLPAACIGPQLISYNGMTATSPAGQYAGVNLSYTLVSGQVVSSPVLIHLPRIDNAETVQVQQNSATDQIFYFHTIPGVKVTVYAGTTLSLDDGSQPNPFPLVALSIPLDRLPDQMPTTGMLMPFIVAFQPANAVASQPVAVNFPNSLGVAPNSSVMFVTLDPTHGYMVPYGTGTVSNDGTEFVADADPNHPGHAYGLVHFDWHGPATNPSNGNNPTPNCGCGNATAGDPVDIGSGLVSYTATDLQIAGRRGGLTIERTYRSSTSNSGAFGLGGSSNYAYQLNTFPLLQGQALLDLQMPDGNQYVFNQAPDGTFINSSIPVLRGAVISGSTASGIFTLKWVDGTVYGFTIFSQLGQRSAFLTSITDIQGNKTTLTLNSTNPFQIQTVTDPVGRSLTFTFDSSNRITQIVDPIGRKVSYTYNSVGALATFTDANSGVTKYTYDSKNNLATITDPRTVVVEQNTYNESFDGRVTQQIQADGGVYKFAYTLQNPTVATSPVLQTVVTDPLGNQTTYRYDMQGFLQSVTDASGQTRVLTHDPNHFNLVSDYTGNGTCPVCGNTIKGDIHYTFDGLGDIVTATDSLGDKIAMTYDTRFNKVNSITDPLGNTTTITYDASANPISVTDANGRTTQTAYDQFGESIQIVDTTGAKTVVTYDAFGNVSSVTDALGNITNFTFDGVSRLTQVQDALQRKGVTTYDALNRVTSVTDPLGNKTQLAYDAVGGLLALTDPKGNVTSFTYDSREQVSARTSALGKKQTYQYDLDSNLTQFTDRRGQVSNYSYDSLNRIVTATYQDSTVSYSYDPAGRLLAVTDSLGGSFGFKYDTAGRLIQQSEPTGIVQYARDALGRVATEQVVGQSPTTYTYDPVGNMLSAAMPSAGVTYSYDARNLPLTLSRTNGVVSTFSYDAIGQLLTLVHAQGASVLNSFAYKYDAVGDRSQVASPSAAPLTTQSSASTVDNGNQLLTNANTTYTYDANGNRLTETTSSGTRTYSWDSRNRLSSVTDTTGNTSSLRYDFTRNLLSVASTNSGSSTTQTFVVDAYTNVASITPSGGSPLSILNGHSIDSHFASVSASGAVAFDLMDALGSTTLLTDAVGAASSALDYEPYGQVNGTVSSVTFPFAFTGRIPIIGNVQYLRNRFYDAGVGRFLSEDPLGAIGGGQSLYAYAGNNPIGDEDQTGLTRKYYSQSLETWLERKAGKALAKAIGDDELEALTDKIFDPNDDNWDKLADAVSCVAGDARAGDAVKVAHDVYGVAKDVASTAEAAELAIAAIPTGPIGWIIGGGYLAYQTYELVKDSWELGKDSYELYKASQQGPGGGLEKCKCASQ